MATPVTIADGRRQLRLSEDDSSMDEKIVGYIDDAAAWIEDYTGHLLVARDVTAHFDSFGDIQFDAWPIKPDAVPAISYLGQDGASISVPAARANVARRPVRLQPWFGTVWPVLGAGGPVKVTIRAGYEPGDDVPHLLRRAMLTLISALEADQEGGEIFQEAVLTARALCVNYKLHTV